MSRPLPILLYHEGFSYLAEHLQYLKDKGYASVHLREVADYLVTQDRAKFPPDKIVVLTFDDAYQNFFEKVRPLLDKYGFKAMATVCVPTGYVSDNPESRKLTDWENGPGLPTMTWEELEILKNEEFEIIPHSVLHLPLDQIENNQERLRDEIGGSKQELIDRLGIEEPLFFCLPGGAGWGKEKINAVLRQESYIGALRAQFECGQGWDQFSIPRRAVEDGQTIESVLQEIAACT